tara:strand:+ start:1013 stop:1138 length:126 start_codon:yes stop_codon:yes gene_type:complete
MPLYPVGFDQIETSESKTNQQVKKKANRRFPYDFIGLTEDT